MLSIDPDEKGYGAAQNMWMKGVSQSMFEARVWLMDDRKYKPLYEVVE